MADLSGMSLDDLMRFQQQLAPPPQAAQPSAAPPSLATMSDADLTALHQQVSAPRDTTPPPLPPSMQPAPARTTKSGSFLPLTRDEQGNINFDSNAGFVGAMKRTFTLPGEAMKGEIDPSSAQGMDRALEAATVLIPTSPATRARGLLGGVNQVTHDPVPVPTADALKAAASKGYDAVRDAGVDYSSSSVSKLASEIRTGLDQKGFISETAPITHKILDKLENAPPGSVAPISGIDAARQAFRKASGNFANPQDQAASQIVIDGLDKFIANPPEKAVLAGPASQAAADLTAARGNYAAAKRSDKITGIEDSADLRAAAANSGRNGDNAIRQRVASLLLSPKQAAGFSEAELAQLDNVARGDAVRNTARTVGNLLGGGGGLGAIATGGAGGAAGGYFGGSAGVAAGMALPAIGYGSKGLANYLTAKALRGTDEAIRMRSPLYEDAAANAPRYIEGDAKRNALIKLLTAGSQGQDR